MHPHLAADLRSQRLGQRRVHRRDARGQQVERSAKAVARRGPPHPARPVQPHPGDLHVGLVEPVHRHFARPAVLVARFRRQMEFGPAEADTLAKGQDDRGVVGRGECARHVEPFRQAIRRDLGLSAQAQRSGRQVEVIQQEPPRRGPQRIGFQGHLGAEEVHLLGGEDRRQVARHVGKEAIATVFAPDRHRALQPFGPVGRQRDLRRIVVDRPGSRHLQRG